MTVDLNGNPILMCYTSDFPGAATELGLLPAYPYNDGGGAGYSDYVIASFAPDASLNWARWYGSANSDGVAGGLSYTISGMTIGYGNELYVGGSWVNGALGQAYISRIDNSSTPNELWQVNMPAPGNCNSALDELSTSCTGTVYAVGETNCGSGSGFATGNALDPSYAGGTSDGFIAEVQDLGTSGNLIYTSYHGGDGRDVLLDVYAQQPAKVYCGGYAESLPGTGLDVGGFPDWALGIPVALKGFFARFSNVDDCCPADIAIPDGALSSTYGTSITGQNLRVEGTWNIDQTITLTNCTVYMTIGSQIVVGVGAAAQFNLDNTHLMACEDMWVGVRTQTAGSGIRMDASSIADAQYGVDLVDGTHLTAFDSDFINNYDGVRVPPPTLIGGWNTVSIKLRNCLFATTGGGLKAPFPGQSPPPGHIGFAGVEGHRTNFDLSSDAGFGDNVFRNHNHAIWTKDVGFTVERCRFEDIHPDPAYGGLITDGAAIFSRGYGGYLTLKQIGKGTGIFDPTTFLNCKWGIWTEGMNLNSSLNKMSGSSTLTGYHVRFSGNRSVEIAHNDLNVQWTGVDLRFNDGATSLSVHDNTILFGLNSAVGAVKGTAAIDVQEMNGYNPASVIHTNHIFFRIGSPSATDGIRLTSAARYTVRDNDLAMFNQPINRYGISLAGSNANAVSCNSITGQTGWAANWALSNTSQCGLRQSLGNNNRFACNSGTLTRQGAIFNGYAPTTDLRGTNFGVHDIGLLLTTGALIGPQVAKGNIWWSPAATIGAQWIGPSFPIVVANPILVNSGLNPLCQPSTWSPLNWFNPTSVPNFTCTSGVPICPSPILQSNGERSSVLDEAVMQGVVENGIYTEETQLTLAYELYTAMTEDPSLYAGGAYSADFLATMESSVSEALRSVEEPRKQLYDIPGAVLAQVQQNEADIATLLEQIKAAREQLEDPGLTPAQVAALEADIAAWEANLNSLSTWNKTAMANLDAARIVEAQLLKSETGLIASSELIEQNAKTVNDIYFGTVGKSGELVVFDVSQAGTLFDIANQCPLVGGNPVYQARALYSLVDGDAEFDDALLCASAGYVVKSEELEAPRVSVYPNPSRTGRITIELYELPAGVHTTAVALYDAQGERILKEDFDGSRTSLNVGSIAQGLYYWAFILDGHAVQRGKVTIF